MNFRFVIMAPVIIDKNQKGQSAYEILDIFSKALDGDIFKFSKTWSVWNFLEATRMKHYNGLRKYTRV